MRLGGLAPGSSLYYWELVSNGGRSNVYLEGMATTYAEFRVQLMAKEIRKRWVTLQDQQVAC